MYTPTSAWSPIGSLGFSTRRTTFPSRNSRRRTSADGHARQQDLSGGSLAAELLDELRDALVEQVVAQIHDEGIAADEALADLDGVRQASRRVLLDVGDLDPPPRAVADGGTNLRLRVADDNADFTNAGVGDRFDPVEQHGLVGDRHELFGAGVGQRPEPRALPAAENQSLHCPLPLRFEGA
jgi:hypothetical protein